MSRYKNRKNKKYLKKICKELDQKGYFIACNGKYYKAEEINYDPHKVSGSSRYCYEVSGHGLLDAEDYHECDLIHCCAGAFTLDEIMSDPYFIHDKYFKEILEKEFNKVTDWELVEGPAW